MAVVPGPVTVNDVVLMVLWAIASLKVTVMSLRPTGTPVTPHAGVVDATAGTGGRAAVVKPHVNLAAMGVPVADFAAVVTVIVIRVL
jgi:hypothetical protein